jgi:hypothetical protein
MKEKSRVSNLAPWSRVSQKIIKQKIVKTAKIPQYKESIIKHEIVTKQLQFRNTIIN